MIIIFLLDLKRNGEISKLGTKLKHIDIISVSGRFGGMPTYDYECEKCGTFEVFHSIKKKLKKCPKCGRKVKRWIGAGAGIIFKGSGFYETDYKKKEKKK